MALVAFTTKSPPAPAMVSSGGMVAGLVSHTQAKLFLANQIRPLFESYYIQRTYRRVGSALLSSSMSTKSGFPRAKGFFAHVWEFV